MKNVDRMTAFAIRIFKNGPSCAAARAMSRRVSGKTRCADQWSECTGRRLPVAVFIAARNCGDRTPCGVEIFAVKHRNECIADRHVEQGHSAYGVTNLVVSGA